MDITAQWPQDIGVVKVPIDEEKMVNSNITTCSSRPTSSTMLERKASRPQKEQALNCPRCNSTNTKFCYYNNYSLTQPRYFCKTCRRYWTEGGSLRNVPVGGGSRKNKRSSTTSSSSTTTTTTSSTNSASSSKNIIGVLLPADHHHHHHHNDHLSTSNNDIYSHQSAASTQNPKIIQGQDLNLAYPIRHEYHHHQNITDDQFVDQLPNLHENNNNNNNNDPSPTSTTTTSSLSALELLRTGITNSRGLNSFLPPTHTNTVYSSSGFALQQDFKPTLDFGLDGLGGGGGYGVHHHHQEGNHNVNGRLSFPFEDLKQVSISTSTIDHDHHHHQFEQNRSGQGTPTTTTTDTNGYWNGMLGGGTW